MKFIIGELGLEVTRRCNQVCKDFCMRGPMQNINLSPAVVDHILNDENIEEIYSILFSGGEPTLNEDLIVYIVDKIIKENLNVKNLALSSNGLKFSQRIVDAFERFVKHKDGNTAIIGFSNDQFHKPIPENVKEQYLKSPKNIIHVEQLLNKRHTYRAKKSGFATEGVFFDYKEQRPYETSTKGKTIYITDRYVSATGNYTFGCDGSYKETDEQNFGKVIGTSIPMFYLKHIKKEIAKHATPHITKLDKPLHSDKRVSSGESVV